MQNKFLSLRAVHILGQLNLGADLHLRDELRPREWSLHPQTGRFSRAEVDLFHFIRDNPLLPLVLSFSSFASGDRQSGSCMAKGLLICLLKPF